MATEKHIMEASVATHVQDITSQPKSESCVSKEDLEASQDPASPRPTDPIIAETPKRTWRSYIWDSLDKDPRERKLVFKLDCALLTIGCLGYFVKFLDQVNINNAFVSGMKEDLGMLGNELNYMQTAWSVGYVLGGVPSNILLTRVRPSLFIPCIEIMWGVLTFSLVACKTWQQMCAVRFLVGLFESALFPGFIYIIGSWYRADELAKRTCIFQVTNAIGGMFSGYLMAATYHLEGVGGYYGWQWLFIVDGIITMPIAIAGFFVLPDLPETTRAWFLNAEERKLCVDRMLVEGRAQRQPYTKSKILKIATGWHFWILVPMYVCWNNGTAGAQPVFQQFLKSTKRYSVEEINVYPTIGGVVQIVATLAFAWTSDSVLKGRRWPAILIGGVVNLICYGSLWYWNIPDGWKWACYIINPIGAATAGLIMSWANEVCTADNEERALVTGSMNQFAYAFQIWVPLLAWQQVKQPRYTAGFALVTILNVALIAIVFGCMYLQQQVKRGNLAQ